VVGIVDRSKDPAHGWRHHFEDAARRAGCPRTLEMDCHTNAMNESEGCGRGYRYLPAVTASWLAKMGAPLKIQSATFAEAT
jgi:hypothetical protein